MKRLFPGHAYCSRSSTSAFPSPDSLHAPDDRCHQLFRRTAVAAGLLMTLFASPSLFAFDRDLHERLVNEQLPTIGFDEETTDEVGDAANLTDIWELFNAEAHADANELDSASARLVTKMERIPQLLGACERRDAIKELGAALHTVADVFAHSNAIDNGFTPNILGMAHGTAQCDANAGFAPDGLVSGYFSAFGYVFGNQCLGMPAGMCCHRDLNKDNSGVPNGANFAAAYAKAGSQTLWYVNQVMANIEATASSSTQARFMQQQLRERQRTAMFVIDTTGSMSSDISAVRSQVSGLVDQIVAGGEAPTLGLVTFKDYASWHGKFCDTDDFKATVATLSASGGGDCPEASNSAMVTALSHFPVFETDYQMRGGQLYVSTDASAGDAARGPEVLTMAQQRGVSINAILTGDCVAEGRARGGTFSDNGDGVVDLAPRVTPQATFDPLTALSARTQLRALTERTGGVLYQVSRSEVSSVVPTMLAMGAPDNTLLRSWTVTPAAGSTAEVVIPVDDQLSGEVSFLVSAAGSNSVAPFTLYDPAGNPVDTATPGVTRLRLSSLDKYTVSAPTVGNWRIQFQASANVTVRAFGRSSLLILDARLLDPALPLPNPDVVMMPVEGTPVLGQRVTGEFGLSHSGRTLDEVVLRRPSGEIITTLTPTASRSGNYQVPFTIPAEPFIIEVAGRTEGGTPFVRQVQLPVSPQSVALGLYPKAVLGEPGGIAEFEVTIDNLGAAAASFDLKASNDSGWSMVIPAPVTVAAGGNATVTVGVNVPTSAMQGEITTLTLIVENSADRNVRNSASGYLSVGSVNQAPVCTAAQASTPSLWPVNHKFVEEQVLGVADPDGDPVTITITAITQDEPLATDGSGNTLADGAGVGTASASVRAERAGTGDGRVYAIGFSADDGRGGSCAGRVKVEVPHSQNGTALDSGQLYDSTGGI